MGRDRRFGMDLAQLPRLRRLRPAAVVQALRRSEGGPARQSAAATECPDDPRPRYRCPAARQQRSGGGALGGVLRAAVPWRLSPRPLLPGRIPGRHADADPGRRRRLPQTLDPARQLRRDPRLGADEDQRRLRLRRRGAADQDDRTVPRHPDRPRRDRRLHRLRRPDRRGRRDRGRPPAEALRRHLRRLRRRPGRDHPASEEGREHPRRRKSARLRTHPQGERMPRPRHQRLLARLRRHRPRAGPAGRHQRHQGPPHRPPARSPTTSSRARSSAGTRRRPSSATWAS